MILGDPHKVGQLMRERRSKLGFTIKQMAEAVGVSPITIMRIELGRVGYIHEKTAKALEVPQKVTHRMVSVPVGVMQDGSMRPLDELKALPPTLVTSGDAAHDAVEQAKPIQWRAKRPAAPPVRRVARTKPSLRKRLFLWLAGE